MDPRLLEIATANERKHLEAIKEHGSGRAAAVALGMTTDAVNKSVRALNRRAARLGIAPGHFENGVAPGYLMGKVTVQRGKDGGVERTWERQSPEAAASQEAIHEAIRVLSEPCKGLAPIIPGPAHTDGDLAAFIPVGDPHFGLYVWAEECGENFDTEIASKLSAAAVDRLIASAPQCSVGVLLLLGDITHANDQTNQTPGHKHQLDVDSRFVRVIRVTVETWRRAILRMKERFGKVVVKLLPGNHDPQAVWALAYALHAYFDSDPDVEVDLGPSKFWYFVFGNVLIGATHGDTVKPDRLPGIMAADRPQEWGKAKFRHWYTGHIHSKHATEYPGVQWESFRTLAPIDSYAASHGYRSGRDMVLIVHHRDHGEVERHRCDVGMLS